MVRVRGVDAPLLPSRTDDVLGIGNLVLDGGDLELGGCRDYGSESLYQPDVRGPDLPLALVVGGLLLGPIGFGTKSQVFVRRRVGEPARNGLKLDKETTLMEVRWTRVPATQ